VTRGVVLDTSALVAALLSEPGGEAVPEAFASGWPLLLSAVNLAEVIAILHRRRGLSGRAAAEALLPLQLEIVPFGPDQAIAAGGLEPVLRRKGISLGDRACLMLARERGLPVLTADRAWAALDLGVEVRLIR